MLVRTSDVPVTHNTILRNTGNTANPGGLTIREGVTGTSATCNIIADNNIGIWVKDTAGVNNKANFNDIHDNTAYGVQNNYAGTFDARWNWWGDDSGPGPVGPGSGDKVSANVLYDPWNRQAVDTTTATGTASFSPNLGNIAGLAAVPTPPSPPVVLPHGMFNFTICCLNPGDTVTLTITLPDPVPVGTKWWKYHNNSWSSLPIGSDNGDNIITVTLKDGRTPDDEDTIPGQITDQGGPDAGAAVGWETYPISKVRVLLPWIALFAAIMAGVSLLVLRRRRAQS